MAETRRFGFGELVMLLAVLAAAGGARAWYLYTCADGGNSDGVLRVQDRRPPLDLPPGTEMRGKAPPNELDGLAHNLKEHGWYGSLAPFAAAEELTAHTATGYPWLLALLERSPVNLGTTDRTVRWAQCVLGSLTAGLYFLFARAAFPSRLVALLAGLLTALNPFGIISAAEIDDGVLASFLLAAALFLGSVGGQSGGALTSLLYGLTLAGLALVRAALLPFAFLAVLWFLLRCRSLRGGWLCALVTFLGFLIGVVPWTLHNLHVWGEPIPIVDSTYLHLWMGNNPDATGGPQSEQAMLEALARSRDEDPQAVADDLAGIENQRQRYNQLGRDVWREVQSHPADTLRRRLGAGLCFFVGERWLQTGELAEPVRTPEAEMPGWLADSYPIILQGTLLVMLLFGALGWRWTYAWRYESMPAALAAVWVPLPYLLSHAAALSGPRLPLDGVLLTYAAFALVCVVPGVRGNLIDGSVGRRAAEGAPG